MSRKVLVNVSSTQKLGKSLALHKRLLGTVVGGGAIAVLGLFGLTHPAPISLTHTADSGDETKFPAYSSPAVAGMNMGATQTPAAADTTLATSKAVPAIKAGS
jgi:hypothetical protein